MSAPRSLRTLGLALLCAGATAPAAAMPVDLSAWTGESYPAVGGFSAGSWQVAADNESVTQTQNGQPTVFYSPFSARNTDVNGTLEVLTASDDDLVGFVLGFEPGDATSPTADYLLVDWKEVTQTFNFSGTPGANSTPGSTAQIGLALSRVTGIPTADELWGHVDFPQNPDGGVTELARATNLGSTDWDPNVPYEFRFVFTATSLEIYVDDVLEIDVAGDFADGRLGFYNFSQGSVRYSAFTSVSIPEPGAALLVALGLAGAARRRRV